MNPEQQFLAIKPKQITLTRLEGPTAECDKPVTVPSFWQADMQLCRWAHTMSPASRKGGYDKVRFTIEWPPESGLGTYSGRYDLEHWQRQMPNLELWVDQHCKWVIRNSDDHWTVTEDDVRYCAKLTGAIKEDNE